MRNMNVIIKQFIIATLGLVLLNACGKQTTFPDIIREPSANHGQVRFYNFVMNGPTVNFYANGIKSTSIVSATGEEAATGVGWGGTHPSIGYVEIPVGTNVKIDAITPKNMVIPANNINNYEKSLLAASLTIPKVEGLKQYSVYLCGLWDKVTQKGKAFYIEDQLPGVDTSKVFMRFVNSGVEEAGPLRFVVTNRDTLIGSFIISESIPYATATSFVAVPYGVYDLKLYTMQGDSLIRNGITLNPDRVHTFALRGNILSKTPIAPFIDNVQNR